MAFNIEHFISEPSLAELELTKKDELLTLARHFTVDVQSGVKKAILIQYLVDKGQLPESVLQKVDTSTSSNLESLRLELDFRFREKALELDHRFKEKQLELEHKYKAAEASRESRAFDLSRQIMLVPPFKDKEVDKYFLHFEKVAVSIGPKKSGLCSYKV